MKIRKPTFYDDFFCVGKDCPLTCCGGWKILVDEKMEREYKLCGGEIAKFARKGMTYDKEMKAYSVNMTKSGLCPMLDEQQLCKIVLKKGSELLCRTCAVFPREKVLAYDTKEKYIFLGCPRAVQLLLQSSGQIGFVTENEETKGKQKDIFVLDDVTRINLNIRATVADFLQTSTFPLWFREFYGAYTIEKLLPYIKEKNAKMVEQQLEHLYTQSFFEGIYNGVAVMEQNRQQQFQALCGTVNAYEKILYSSMFFDQYGYAKKIFQLLKKNRECTFEQWEEARKKWKFVWNSQQWENILVYNWMRTAFVSQKEDKLLTNYLACVLTNIVSEHLLILLSIEEIPDEEMICSVIAYVARMFLHGSECITEIMKLGMEQGILTSAYFIRLCNLEGD